MADRAICGLILVLAAASMCQAGPLVPPVGAISSTGKTLTEVEPRIPISGPIVITSDGSYYLTGNITGIAGADVIDIRARNVTLDLNGFTITGGRTGVIIPVTSVSGSITIQNGTIRGVSGSGIFSVAASLSAFSPPTTVRNVSLQDIADAGVFLGGLCTVEGVTVNGRPGSSSSRGVFVLNGSQLRDVRVFDVSGRGIEVDFGSLVDRCTVVNAATEGIFTGQSCTVTGCMVQGGTVGYAVGPYGRLKDSTSFIADRGVVAELGATVENCTVSNGSGDAFTAKQGTVMRACTASVTAGNGFVSITGVSTFEDCSVYNVELNGFQIFDGCVVTGCTVATIGSNSQFQGPVSSGVLVTGTGNRIEGNRFVACGYPVFMASTSAQNTVFRNSSVQQTNGYADFGSSNQLGPVRTGTTQPVGPWDNTAQ